MVWCSVRIAGVYVGRGLGHVGARCVQLPLGAAGAADMG